MRGAFQGHMLIKQITHGNFTCTQQTSFLFGVVWNKKQRVRSSTDLVAQIPLGDGLLKTIGPMEEILKP